jgi:hypothetical protein
MLPDIVGTASSFQVFFDDGLTISRLVYLNIEVFQLVNTAAKIPMHVTKQLKSKSLP